MKFVVLNYALDRDLWNDGQMIGNTILRFKEENTEEYSKFVQIPSNQSWIDTFEEEEGFWPHPNKILIDIYNLEKTVFIDWMPEINYLGVYIESDELLKHLIENYDYMMSDIDETS